MAHLQESESPDLWQRVTALDALQEAWAKVAANEGGPGGDRITIDQFRYDLFANLTQLRADLLSGAYRSGPFRKVAIPKRKPGYRILTIPSVRDRVVHTSIANALTPIFEPLFEDCSFAYRPNRGVAQAVARIERWRNRGFSVVVEADIISYFDNIDQEILKEKIVAVLTPLPGSAALLQLISNLLQDEAEALGFVRQGLVQGSPLSPLLANLYLDALDEEIDELGVKIVRFADDFVILCKSEKKAKQALEHSIRVLEKHNLKLHEDGTRIVSFDKGFDFIGYLFLRTLALKEKRDPDDAARAKPIKSEITDDGVIELGDSDSRFDPGKRVLYVLDPDHRLATRNRSFSVSSGESGELIAIPGQRVGRIEIGEGVDLSRASIDLALDNATGLAIIDGFGQTRGVVSAFDAKRAALHMAQAKAVLREEFRLAVAKRLIDARIRNQRTQIMRLDREAALASVEMALDAMKRCLRKLEHAQSVPEVLGAEGAATALYWPALASLAKQMDLDNFTRSRPARDPLNAAINYLTAILERDMRAALQCVGLHVGFAFLHGTRDRHEGLIYDVMEPFRAPLTEGLAVYLFNAKRLRPEMFLTGGERLQEISAEGRKAIVSGYETAVARRINRPDGKGKLGWKAMMQHQARSLAHAVQRGDAGQFTPYVMEP